MFKWVRKQIKPLFLGDGKSSRKNIEISPPPKSDRMGSHVSEGNLRPINRFDYNWRNNYWRQSSFRLQKKRSLVKKFHFMQGGVTPHRIQKVFKAIYNVYGNPVIGLGYPKFAQGGQNKGDQSKERINYSHKESS